MTPTTADLSSPARIAGWRDYIQLLKPRVMSLVVFTALTGMVCARHALNPALGFIAILAIAIGAGGSGALNMAYDGDIDALMRRTKSRPVPAGRIQAADALALGVTLSLFSVMVLGIAANWLAAGLLAFTIAFYGIVYTLWLKRRTAQNIVIGGLAGALPPLVGWAAAGGAVPPNAWLLVAIIFIWTPPHFWALSLYTSADYAKAGVPMMPVTHGARSTRRQIVVYSVALALVGLAPAATGLGGWIYLIVAALGGAIFVGLAVRLAMSDVGEISADGARSLYDTPPVIAPARDLFAFSIGYLFVLFATLLGEHLAAIAPFHPLLGNWS